MEQFTPQNKTIVRNLVILRTKGILKECLDIASDDVNSFVKDKINLMLNKDVYEWDIMEDENLYRLFDCVSVIIFKAYNKTKDTKYKDILVDLAMKLEGIKFTIQGINVFYKNLCLWVQLPSGQVPLGVIGLRLVSEKDDKKYFVDLTDEVEVVFSNDTFEIVDKSA